ETTLWSDYAAQLASAAASASVGNALSGVPPADPATAALLNYYATVALYESQEVATDETEIVGEENLLTQCDVALSDQSETATIDLADETADAGQLETDTLSPEQAQAAEDTADDQAQTAGDDADAQAAYVTDTSQAQAKFYQDKAAASRDYDNSIALAEVTRTDAKATAVEGYDEYLAGIGPFIDVSAASAAAEAAYAAAQKTAWITLIGKDGDAEINQSQTDGGAEQTLAQALGLDEKSLTGEP